MKIYMCQARGYHDDHINEYLITVKLNAEKVKEILDEREYGIWTVDLHNYLRKILGLPNKIFGIGSNKERTKAYIILFDKEPDGKYYKVFKDGDDECPYIVVKN